jgi:N-hydroxyarylamine O-acetyltransferase
VEQQIMGFDLATYLGRIGIGEIAPTAEGLQQLQFAQMRTIPFENITPLLGDVPDLAPETVWQKLVLSGRGGYCFELNGLFGRAIEAAGFAATPVLCRVRLGAPAGGPRSHLAWIVTIDGREWLADAGFGGPGPTAPLVLIDDEAQETGGIRFRIRPDPATGESVVERQMSEGWFPLYGFDRGPVFDPDIEAANFVTARWDKSPFPTHLMVNITRPDGRASLFNTAAKIDKPGKVEEWIIGSGSELHGVLADLFGLACDPAITAAVWKKTEANPTRRAA